MIWMVTFIVLNVVDLILYCWVVTHHGPQWNFWPGGGIYLWLKYTRFFGR